MRVDIKVANLAFALFYAALLTMEGEREAKSRRTSLMYFFRNSRRFSSTFLQPMNLRYGRNSAKDLVRAWTRSVSADSPEVSLDKGVPVKAQRYLALRKQHAFLPVRRVNLRRSDVYRGNTHSDYEYS